MLGRTSGGSCPSYIMGLYTVDELNDMIFVDGYIPVASTSEYDSITLETSVTMGAGTCWEDTYTNDLSGKYVQVLDIDYAFATPTTPSVTSGFIFDGNELLITGLPQNLFIDFPDGCIARNLRASLTANTTGSSQTIDNFIARNLGGIVEDCEFIFDISNTSTNISAKGVVADALLSTGIIRRVSLIGDMTCSQSASGLCVGAGRGTMEDISISGTLVSTATGAGGLVGAPSALMTISRCYMSVDITGLAAVGGCIGGGGNTSSGTVIQDCYVTGTITATTTGNALVGGFLGDFRQNTSTIKNCYVNGAVVTDGAYSGGFGGTPRTGVAFENCYCVTTITGTGGQKHGFSDTFGATESNCYYDSDVFTGGSDLGTGKTTSELQTPTTNSGIYSAWTIPPWDFGTDSEYPILTTVP